MVMDHINRVVFACLSTRTDPIILDKFCALMGYGRVVFNASDHNGVPIYHTNVMMSIGSTLAIVCSDSIKAEHEREEVISKVKDTSREILHISLDQMQAFAGNMIELVNTKTVYQLLLSATHDAGMFVE